MGGWRVGRAGWIEDGTLAVLCALVAAVGVLARLVRHGGDTGVVAGIVTGFAMRLRWGGTRFSGEQYSYISLAFNR